MSIDYSIDVCLQFTIVYHSLPIENIVNVHRYVNVYQRLIILMYQRCMVPICSMVLEYLPTKPAGHVCASFVGTYSSTMEHLSICKLMVSRDMVSN